MAGAGIATATVVCEPFFSRASVEGGGLTAEVANCEEELAAGENLCRNFDLQGPKLLSVGSSRWRFLSHYEVICRDILVR
jgi:hypothetical protein